MDWRRLERVVASYRSAGVKPRAATTRLSLRSFRVSYCLSPWPFVYLSR